MPSRRKKDVHMPLTVKLDNLRSYAFFSLEKSRKPAPKNPIEFLANKAPIDINSRGGKPNNKATA
ncbi:hypothetical protein MJO28_017186 [Puccinia striiformis f. sp. tritici]|nr:hypothetical protein MJO28_017892 [Puccinia striiformis f. sp. tritici]KAI7934340.1 hypothetical protein MJO28_017186 [Puccinia striiformis f. sp. tritici]